MTHQMRSMLSHVLGDGGSVYEALARNDQDRTGRDFELGDVAQEAEDEEVPVSFMMEGGDTSNGGHGRTNRHSAGEATRLPNPYVELSSKQLALWKWANVENLDNYLQDIYAYYTGNGIYSTLLARVLNLATIAFVVMFSFYLTNCIDYRAIRADNSLAEVTCPNCFARMSWSAVLLAFILAVAWLSRLLQYVLDIPRLWEMHNLYTHVLEIEEGDLQTISWHEITRRLMNLRDSNAATANALRGTRMQSLPRERMDPHDIANRVMRRENYMISMINKDILDLTAPIWPFHDKPFLTKTLEWNLNMCVMQFVFDQNGQIRPIFLSTHYRRALSDGLRRRFIFAGIMNLLLTPFIIVYLCLYYFFRYFNEYHKDPASLGSRQYTPLAIWKFREFNELPHLVDTRLKMSYKYAARYVNQFPKDKVTQVSKFVSFIAGSFFAVLVLASLLDADVLSKFEITHERSASFYIVVFGAILAVSRGMIPEDHLVFEPEVLLKRVAEYTHYMPIEWTRNIHSPQVKDEFCRLYDLKLTIFLWELLSVLLTPAVLWFSLPKCSQQIIDFFRQFTVHVDGIGYVCSFAVFDFERHGDQKYGAPSMAKDARFMSNEGKMEKSFMNFRSVYPDWVPRGELSPAMEAWQPSQSALRSPIVNRGVIQSTMAGQLSPVSEDNTSAKGSVAFNSARGGESNADGAEAFPRQAFSPLSLGSTIRSPRVNGSNRALHHAAPVEERGTLNLLSEYYKERKASN